MAVTRTPATTTAESRRDVPMDERIGSSPRRRRTLWLVLAATILCPAVFFALHPHESASSVAVTTDYRNFESVPVHPVALTPDGSKLLALNLPDARLEVFSIGSGALTSLGGVPLGLQPVSVVSLAVPPACGGTQLSVCVSLFTLRSMNAN